MLSEIRHKNGQIKQGLKMHNFGASKSGVREGVLAPGPPGSVPALNLITSLRTWNLTVQRSPC